MVISQVSWVEWLAVLLSAVATEIATVSFRGTHAEASLRQCWPAT